MLFNYAKAKKSQLVLLIVLTFLLIAGAAGSAGAVGRLALLPLADITIDYNGVDLKTSALLTESLNDQGFELVDNYQVRHYLANNRLYYTGALDAFNARKIGRDLDCDIILSGTIVERAESQSQARFGITITAVSTRNGAIAWSLKESSSLKEETAILGIGEPHSQAELENLIMTKLERKLKYHLLNPTPTEATEVKKLKPFQITDFRITPDYLKSGSQVESFLRLSCLDSYPDKVTIMDGAGNNYPLHSTKSTAGEYRGSWTTPQHDDNYAVSLILEWLSDKGCFTETDLTTYQTCSTPPELKVEFKQGYDKNDITIFSKQLLIISQNSQKKPMAAWQIQVAQADGRVVLEETYDGGLPSRLYWQGCDRSRKPLADGLYNFYLKVWDAAGNNTVIKKKLSIQRACTPLSVKTTKRQQKNLLIVHAASSNSPELSPQWKLDLFSPEGAIILKTSGTTLPAEIELPHDYHENFVLCEIEAQDLIGNRFSLSEERVPMPGYDHQLAQHQDENHWSEDF